MQRKKQLFNRWMEFLKSPLNIFVSESFILYNLLKLQVSLLLLQYFLNSLTG